MKNEMAVWKYRKDGQKTMMAIFSRMRQDYTLVWNDCNSNNAWQI
jgi:hypothetical protein